MGVFRTAWTSAYVGLIPSLYLTSLIDRRDAAWWRSSMRSEPHFLVLEVDGKIAGYATCGKARRARQLSGEIYELYLGPIYQGCGLGQDLFESCRARLDIDGYNGLVVWALAENDQACEFYARLGGRVAGRTKERLGSKDFTKLAFTWT